MKQAIDFWAIVELMGHVTLAGHLSEIDVAGQGMLRLSVPAVGDLPPWEKLIGTSAVYSITPVTEEAARQVCHQLQRRPITLYGPPLQHRLSFEDDEEEEDDE